MPKRKTRRSKTALTFANIESIDSPASNVFAEEVEESGNVLRDITKVQQQSISFRSAFANYVRDSILTMSKTKFKKARSSITHTLSELMEYSDDEVPTTTAQAAPVPTTQQPVFSQRHAVRPSSGPTLASFGSYDQQQPRFWILRLPGT